MAWRSGQPPSPARWLAATTELGGFSYQILTISLSKIGGAPSASATALKSIELYNYRVVHV